MALKLVTKADLVGGAIFLGCLGLVLLLMAVLGDQFLLSRIRVSGTVLTPDHPDFPRYMGILRWGAGSCGLLCWLFGWLSFRASKIVSDT